MGEQADVLGERRRFTSAFHALTATQIFLKGCERKTLMFSRSGSVYNTAAEETAHYTTLSFLYSRLS